MEESFRVREEDRIESTEVHGSSQKIGKRMCTNPFVDGVEGQRVRTEETKVRLSELSNWEVHKSGVEWSLVLCLCV